MMSDGAATTAKGYLASLPPETRREIHKVRRVIRDNLPPGFDEIVDFGMLAYVVPLERLPDTYNGHPLPLAALAAQKRYNSVYLMGVYGDPTTEAWFHAEWAKTGKRLAMGKSCLRFRTADDLPLDLLGRTIGRISLEEFVARYRAARARPKRDPGR